MKLKLHNLIFARRRGVISLAEIIAAVLIATILSTAVLRIYSRANSSASSIRRFIKKGDVSSKILQKIAEDIDNVATPGTDAIITLENKFDEGFNICRFSIESRFYDKESKPQTFKKITWQSRYEPDANGLVLYRSHSGMVVEDKIEEVFHSSQDTKSGRELFIPVYEGLTFFKIEVPQGIKFEPLTSKNETAAPKSDEIKMLDKWKQEKLPTSLRIGVSTAPVVEQPTGGYDVEDQDKIYRMVAVDRIRKIKYRFVRQDFNIEDEYNDEFDSEDANDVNDINDAKETVRTPETPLPR